MTPGLPTTGSTPARRTASAPQTGDNVLHSVCGFKSPIDCEHVYWASLSEGLAA